MMHFLIAEDDSIARKLLKNTLVKMGYTVTEAENGRKAWELFNKNPTAFVISDWVMPEMDGLSLCKKIRAAGHESYTYIIILTAKDHKSDLVKVFEAGADDYVSKPFDPDELDARIKTGLRIIQLEGRHRKLQKNLIDSRNKLRIVFDALYEEIVAIDRQEKIVSANSAFVKNASMAADEPSGKKYFNRYNGKMLPGANSTTQKMAADVFETGKPLRTCLRLKLGNGEERFKDVACLPIKTNNESGFSQVVFVSKDITDEHKNTLHIAALNNRLQLQADQVEQKNRALVQTLKRLEETQSQMIQSEKMASIGQLAAGVAHEINNPTGFVASNLSTLLEYQKDFDKLIDAYHGLIKSVQENGHDLPSSISQSFSRINDLEAELDIEYLRKDTADLINDCRDGAARIKKIVSDLKDFAHPGEDRPKTADINKCIGSTLNVVNNELKYKAKVTTDFGQLPLIKCLPQQLNQVFINILINSVQAIEDHGEIHINTQTRDNNIFIVIRDTGSGISEENIRKIFDPFFTTKDVGKGTGLGMHIAYNIIKKHNGAIDVKSQVGKGTAVTIRLPVT